MYSIHLFIFISFISLTNHSFPLSPFIDSWYALFPLFIYFSIPSILSINFIPLCNFVFIDWFIPLSLYLLYHSHCSIYTAFVPLIYLLIDSQLYSSYLSIQSWLPPLNLLHYESPFPLFNYIYPISFYPSLHLIRFTSAVYIIHPPFLSLFIFPIDSTSSFNFISFNHLHSLIHPQLLHFIPSSSICSFSTLSLISMNFQFSFHLHLLTFISTIHLLFLHFFYVSPSSPSIFISTSSLPSFYPSSTYVLIFYLPYPTPLHLHLASMLSSSPLLIPYLFLPYLSLNTPLILISYIHLHSLYPFPPSIFTFPTPSSTTLLISISPHFLSWFSPTLLTFSYYFLPPLYLSSFILVIFISPIHHLLYSSYTLFSYPLPLFIHLYSFIHTYKISHFLHSLFSSIPVMPYPLSFCIFLFLQPFHLLYPFPSSVFISILSISYMFPRWLHSFPFLSPCPLSIFPTLQYSPLLSLKHFYFSNPSISSIPILTLWQYQLNLLWFSFIIHLFGFIPLATFSSCITSSFWLFTELLFSPFTFHLSPIILSPYHPIISYHPITYHLWPITSVYNFCHPL